MSAPRAPDDLADGGCIVNSKFNPNRIWYFVDLTSGNIAAPVAGSLQLDIDNAQQGVAGISPTFSSTWPGVPLKDQGYPNGIPIIVKTFPGAGQ